MTSGHRARLGLAIVCLGALVAPFDTTVNTAFPVITEAFGLPARDVQWVVIAFVIAQSSLALVFGHLGDRFGHRRIFAIGLAASVLAHAAVALAPDFPTLVGMRVLQGMAVGIAVSCAPALATLLYPPADKARVLALYAAAVSMAMALGPLLGGLLIEAFGWPGVFWFRVPLALAALLLVPLLPRARRVPPAPGGRGDGFDWGGAFGLAAVLTCIVLSLVELARPGELRARALPLLAAGIAGAVLFVRHESRTAHPVLRMAPFRSRRFSGIQAASVAINLACFGNLLLLPYVLTREAGATIAATGLLLSTYPGGAVLGSLLAGRLARGWPDARLMAAGLGVAAAGLLVCAITLSASPLALLPLTLGMAASGVGLGLFQVGYMDATTSLLPIEERGVAGSLVSVTRLLGIVLGATGIGWLQGLTGRYGVSFLVLGGGLALFAAAFAVTGRRASTGRDRRTPRAEAVDHAGRDEDR
jgi:MFS family permease